MCPCNDAFPEDDVCHTNRKRGQLFTLSPLNPKISDPTLYKRRSDPIFLVLKILFERNTGQQIGNPFRIVKQSFEAKGFGKLAVAV